MAINTRFVLISGGFAVDSQRNILSVFDILEEIQVINLPAIIPNACVTALLERDNDKNEILDVTLDCILPSGKSMKVGEAAANFQKKPRVRLTWRINGFPIPETGKYKFVFKYTAKDDKNVTGITEISLSVANQRSS